jgi:hypothetical protein
MGIILVLGQTGDPCCQRVQKCLADLGREVVFVPEDRSLPGLDLVWQVQGHTLRGSARYEDRVVEFAEIEAVLARAYGIPVSAEVFATADGRYVSSEWNALLVAWLSSLPCRVVNRLRPELWYKASLNAPSLAALLPAARFKRPRTMVTSRVDDARDFRERCAGRVRYEALTQPMGYRIDEIEAFEKLAALSGTVPLQLVEVIEGHRFAAFVVGDRFVLVADDGSIVREPEACAAEASHEVAQTLELVFCRLGLVRSPRGDWYCMGVERTPLLHDCGEEAQDLVVGYLADHLTSGGRERLP